MQNVTTDCLQTNKHHTKKTDNSIQHYRRSSAECRCTAIPYQSSTDSADTLNIHSFTYSITYHLANQSEQEHLMHQMLTANDCKMLGADRLRLTQSKHVTCKMKIWQYPIPGLKSLHQKTAKYTFQTKKVVPYSITSIGHGDDPSFLIVSPQVTLVINPVVGCRYFSPGPWLLSQLKRSPSLVGTKLYCLVTEAHRCK